MNPDQKPARTRRILLVDDNQSIHDDFKKILLPAWRSRDAETRALEHDLFGDKTGSAGPDIPGYEIDDAYQGEEAVRMVAASEVQGRPYALIFMDVRMPPGIDGIQATMQIWQQNPYIEMVICTAYSDYTWDQIMGRFGATSHLLFLKKPFDTTALRQIALTLTTKWDTDRQSRDRVHELESTVDERTRELGEMIGHLSRMKSEAESAVIARSELLSTIGHEIRNPLNGIMGMTDLLLDTDLNEEQTTYAETIRRSGESINLIVSDLLKYARPESDAVELARLSFDVTTAVENVAELVSVKGHEKGLGIITLINADVPRRVVGDPERLRQVLLYLSCIVIEYTQEGDLLISASARPDPDGTVSVRFEIDGTAVALPAAVCAALAGPGAPDRSGTDPGLDICRKLLERMGGSAGCGPGDTLWFTVRFGQSEAVPPPELPQVRSVEKARVLILGDNAISRKVLSLYLSHWGGSCTEVSSVKDAVEILHGALGSMAPFDLAIVDFKNRDFSQYLDAARLIRQYRNLAGLPLVCLVTTSRRGDAGLAYEAGYSAYLTKPIKQTHLLNCIGLIYGSGDSGTPAGVHGIITKHLIDEMIRVRYRILVIDDAPVRRALVPAIERFGIRCDAATDGIQALRAVHRKNYDLILINCDNRRWDPVETIRRIREDQHEPAPIVGMFAENQPDDRIGRYREAGMDASISGPIEPEKLRQTLERLLDNGSGFKG